MPSVALVVKRAGSVFRQSEHCLVRAERTAVSSAEQGPINYPPREGDPDEGRGTSGPRGQGGQARKKYATSGRNSDPAPCPESIGGFAGAPPDDEPEQRRGVSVRVDITARMYLDATTTLHKVNNRSGWVARPLTGSWGSSKVASVHLENSQFAVPARQRGHEFS
jgi:hypothetical protein